jgi:hypothetical protein
VISSSEARKWSHPRRKKHSTFTSDGTLRELPKARHENLMSRGKLPKGTSFPTRGPLRSKSGTSRPLHSVAKDGWAGTTAPSLWLSIHPIHLAANLGGIPHLAKNERDMGTRP